MKNGVELIAEERKRQKEEKGWTPEHDSQHSNGELSMAAACYAAPKKIYCSKSSGENHLIMEDPFPFQYRISGRVAMESDTWVYYMTKDKKEGKSRLEQLTIAGALVAAEIDRLLELEK